MARIAFLPLPEAGHIHATLGLAKQLASRGHEVVYMTPPDGEAFLHSQGYRFTPILENVLPKGYQAELHSRMSRPGLSSQERKKLLEEGFKKHELRITETLFGSTFESRLRDSGADLLLVDATSTLPVLAAHKAGIPAFQLCTNLALQRDSAVPPLFMSDIPTGSITSRLRIQIAWQLCYLQSFMPGWMVMRKHIRAFYRRYPDAVPGDFHSHLQLGPHLRVPTLVTCAPEFDFRRAAEGIHYLGPCVDLERTEPSLPPEIAGDSAPLVLCSLGSHGDRIRQHQGFFQGVIDAVARRPQWRLLMAVGGDLGLDTFGRLPPNVSVVKWVPQLSALKRAAVMITHGGLNSVKECISLGVPMIVYPLMYDQPGNAARVVHHGLGLRGDIHRASTEQVGAQLDEVLGNPGYRSRVQALQRIFNDADTACRGAETLEKLLQLQGGVRRPLSRSA